MGPNGPYSTSATAGSSCQVSNGGPSGGGTGYCSNGPQGELPTPDPACDGTCAADYLGGSVIWGFGSIPDCPVLL